MKSWRNCSLAFFVALSVAGAAWAQVPLNVERPWFKLEQGKQAFREGDYGNALILFEEAREQRRVLFYRCERVLVDLLSNREVRGLGNNLEKLDAYIDERYLFDARQSLDELYYRTAKESLGNSALAALDAVRLQQHYPEAEYWIAEVYRVEGELALAVSQYKEAFKYHENLAGPEMATTILYREAEVERMRGDDAGFEASIAEILKGDASWSEDRDSFTRQAMRRTLEKDGMDRFVTMYRFSDNKTERAHRMAGDYYFEKGVWALATEHFAFAFLTVATTVIDHVKVMVPGFEYTTMQALMAELARRPDVRAYLEESDFYRTAYYLGLALFESGAESNTDATRTARRNAARTFWSFLADDTPASDWGGRARERLAQG